jgi:restriction endonuclease S subunit
MDYKYKSIKLKDIAQIRTGCNLSRYKRKKESEPLYEYSTLLSNAITEYGIEKNKYSETYEAKDTIKDEFFTKAKDIIMMLREPNTATFIEEEEGFIISSFNLIIRVDHRKADYRFITNYLNSSSIKKQIARELGAARISTISKSAVENLEIHLPPLMEQRRLGDFFQLQNEEVSLLKKIYQKRKEMYRDIKNKIFK